MDFEGLGLPASAGRVRRDEIDLKDERFRISTAEDLGALAASIRRLGLLTAPLVIRAGERFTVVSGFRRIGACRLLEWETLPVRVLEPEADPYACARQAVGENALARPLNPIETGRALRLLESHGPPGGPPAADLQALGLPTHPEMTARLKRLPDLPRTVQEGILEASIPLATALELGRFDAESAGMLADLLRPLRIGLNKQREIVSLAQEAALRESIPLAAVLRDLLAEAAAGGDEADRNQTAQRLRRRLRRRRYPEIAAAEDNFHALRKRLKLGGDLQLTPPRDFEGRGFSLAMTVREAADIDKLRERLEALRKHPELQRLFEGKSRGFG
jgi:ParB family chromosome partitioning protein